MALPFLKIPWSIVYDMASAYCRGSLLVVMVLGPLYTAYLFVRRYHSGLMCIERWVAAGIVSVGLVVCIFNITAPLYIYNAYIVAGICLLLLVSSHIAWKHYADFSNERIILKSWWRVVVQSRWAVFFFIAVAALLITFLRGLLLPPLSWDSMLYHLYFAGTWVQQAGGALIFTPDVIRGVASFPHNGEVIASWLMLPFYSDLIVNIMNFFFMAIGALSLYALGRRLCLDRGFALFLVCLVCFSPMLYGYITTQYVEVLVFAMLIAAVLFVFRFLKERKRVDIFFMYIALALAAGTKYAALPLAAALFLLVLLVSLRRSKNLSRDIRVSVIFVFIAALFFLLLGGKQYLTNWQQTHNFFYPNQVLLGKHILLPGSAYWEKVSSVQEPTGMRDDLFSIIKLCIYPPYDLPRGSGLKFLFLCIVACYAALRPPGNIKKIIWLLTFFWFIPFICMYASNSANIVLIRRFLPFDGARFLAVSFALMAVAAVLQLATYKKSFAIKVTLALFIIWDLHRMNYRLPLSYKQLYASAILLALLAGLVLFLFRLQKRIRKTGSRRAVVICVVTIFFTMAAAVALLQKYRDATRWRSFAAHIDLHDFPRDYVAGWQWCDVLRQSQTIAFATDFSLWTDRWFLYPLMGNRLQNKVVCVPYCRGEADSAGSRASAEKNDYFLIWKRNLQEQKVDLVFIQEPWPIELEWVSGNPQFFKLEKQGKAFRMYRFTPGHSTVKRTLPGSRKAHNTL